MLKEEAIFPNSPGRGWSMCVWGDARWGERGVISPEARSGRPALLQQLLEPSFSCPPSTHGDTTCTQSERWTDRDQLRACSHLGKSLGKSPWAQPVQVTEEKWAQMIRYGGPQSMCLFSFPP